MRRKHSPFLEWKRSQMLLSTEPTRWPELQMNFYPQTTDASQSPLKHLHWNTIKINNFTFLFYILFRELGEDFMSFCLDQLLCGCLISDYLKWVEPPKTNWLVPSGIVLLHRKLPNHHVSEWWLSLTVPSLRANTSVFYNEYYLNFTKNAT